MSQESSKQHVMVPGNRFTITSDGGINIFRPHFTEHAIPKDAIIVPGAHTQVEIRSGKRRGQKALLDEAGFHFEDKCVPLGEMSDGEVILVLGEEETIYYGAHFAAVPYTDHTYILVHRDDLEHPACQRVFPAEIAAAVVEAIESGFHHGVNAAVDSAAKGFSKFLQQHAGALKSGSVVVHTSMRPIKKKTSDDNDHQ